MSCARWGRARPANAAIFAAAVTVAAAVTASGCGGSSSVPLRADQQPLPIGRGAAFRIGAVSAAVAQRRPVRDLRCSTSRREPTFAVHLELFARRRVLPLPAGIGIAPPQRRRGAYVLAGSCLYPARTYEPTGVVVLGRHAAQLTLGDVFALWGQPLSRHALAGFRGTVAAFLAGRRWSGNPGSIPLRRHAQIVLEVDGFLAPHPRYAFPPGV